MKSVLNTILLLSFMGIGSVLFAANEKPTPKHILKFKTTYSDTFVLYVTALDAPIQMNLKNASGILVFTENLKTGYAYKKTYDISGLSDGTYYAEIIENKKIKLFCVVKGNRNEIAEVEKLPYE